MERAKESVSVFLFKIFFFLMWTFLKSLLNVATVLCFGLLAMRHVDS